MGKKKIEILPQKVSLSGPISYAGSERCFLLQATYIEGTVL